jgi:hypothetical protein
VGAQAPSFLSIFKMKNLAAVGVDIVGAKADPQVKQLP